MNMALRNARLNRGWTQIALAQKSKVNQSLISQMETEKYVPFFEEAARIAGCLGIPLDMLFHQLAKRTNGKHKR